MGNLLHDKMTEMVYVEPVRSFAVTHTLEKVYDIDVLNGGKTPLVEANTTLGLALDEADIEYYYDLFANKLQRNPTNVECFDLAQSNSEHSRHWFFKGRMVIDGVEQEKCLMRMICDTQLTTNDNNVIKFSDNSSAIKGKCTGIPAHRKFKSWNSRNTISRNPSKGWSCRDVIWPDSNQVQCQLRPP